MAANGCIGWWHQLRALEERKKKGKLRGLGSEGGRGELGNMSEGKIGQNKKLERTVEQGALAANMLTGLPACCHTQEVQCSSGSHSAEVNSCTSPGREGMEMEEDAQVREEVEGDKWRGRRF